MLALRVAALATAVAVVLGGLAVIAGVWLGFLGPHQLTPAQVAAQAGPSVVTVEVKVFRGGTVNGLGFFYGKPGHVVTDADLLAKATDVSVIDATNHTFVGDLEGIDRSGHFAELVTLDTKAKPLTPAHDPVSKGAELVLVRNPSGVVPGRSVHGSVSGTNVETTLGGKTFSGQIQMNAVADPLDVGGPVLNTSGELVGMLSGVEAPSSYLVPRLAFDSPVSVWETAGTILAYGPPLVTARANALILGGVGSGWSNVTDEVWANIGWHRVWTMPANDTYGGVAISIYAGVDGSMQAAKNDYEGFNVDALNAGRTSTGALSSLGDEGTGYQHFDAEGRPVYEVIWRDRNFVGIVYLNSGKPPPPYVVMSLAVSIATQQEIPVAANLANFQ